VPDLPVQITEVRAFTMTAALAGTVEHGTVEHGTIEHGDQPHALDQYEQACRPLAEKLLGSEFALR
jgi:hypothetical protein